MPLTDLAVRNLKPGLKPFKRWDERGLFIDVRPNGSLYWRFKYRLKGKEKLLALGVYPVVTLATARRLRDEAQTLITSGKDPLAERKTVKLAQAASNAKTFEAVALEVIETRRAKWTAKHNQYALRRLQCNIFVHV